VGRFRLPVINAAMSLIALIVSIVALGVAVTRDGDTADPPATASPQPGNSATELPVPADDPTSETTGGTGQPPGPTPEDTGVVDPQAEFTLAYERRQQRIPTSISVDLDEPRVKPAAGGDVYYGSSKYFDPDSDAAVVKSANASPQDCAAAIQNEPLTNNIAAAEGLTLCIQTDAGVASSEGITQKMVRLTVKSIDRQDVATVQLTAWNVPS
jgi:hypothetical protein